MSSCGTYRLHLRQERRERLHREQQRRRQQQLRQEAERLLTQVRDTQANFDHHLAQHFGRQAQRQASDLAGQSQQLLSADPDQAVQLARRSLAAIQRGLEQARSQVADWNHRKVQAQEAVSILKLSLESFCQEGCLTRTDDPLVTEAAGHLAKAASALQREEFSVATAVAEKGQQSVGKAESARQEQQEQEAVRREIVQGLKQVLVKMGFSVLRPHLQRDHNDCYVILIGTLPSGRKAEFTIALDGQICYDFDGYQDRKCGKDRAAIRRQLEKLCEAQITETHARWKEAPPLQIGKGSKDFLTDTGGHLYR